MKSRRRLENEVGRRLLPRLSAISCFAVFVAAQTAAQQQNERPAECATWANVKIPPGDLPNAKDRQELHGCFSEDAYFGFGEPVDLAKARKCAYLEREAGDAPVFGGPAMLMMIYANGKGVARNLDLALKFACEVDGAPAENSGRVQHLAGLREQRWAGNDFSLCDDSTSGFMEGACAVEDEKVHAIARTKKLGGIAQKWSPAEKAAFAELQKTANEFFKASTDNEVDTTGTGRGAFMTDWEAWLKDGFAAAVERSEQGRFPSFSADEFREADRKLNEFYADLESAKPDEAGMGTVTPEGIKTAQRAWLHYRDAWVKFGGIKYPNVSAESWRTWLTYDRVVMLHEVPGTEPPDYRQAFQEIVPWRYHYDLSKVMGNADPAELREAIRLKPDFADAHGDLGSDLGANEDWDGAIQEYREAIRLDPHNPEWHHSLGFAFEKKKNWDAAIAEYREVTRLKPDDDMAHRTLGFAFEKKQDWEGAVREYREAMRLKPGDWINHRVLGEALESKQDLDAAIGEYRAAIKILASWDAWDSKPNLAAVEYNLGGALKKKGDVDGAIQQYREALRLTPNWAPVHYSLGNALLEKGALDDAVKEYREAARLNPKDSDPHNGACLALGRKGDHDAAVAECREAVRLAPDDADAHDDLAIALEAKGDRDAAVSEYHEAIRLKPDGARAHYNLGLTLEHKSDFDGALGEYRRAIALDAKYADAYFGLGRLLEATKQLAEAIVQYREAVRLDPANPFAHGALGWALENNKDLDGAIQQYREAVRLKPDWAEAYNNLGWALHNKGDASGAVSALRESLRLKPDYVPAHYDLGIVLRQQGDLDHAISEFYEVLRLVSEADAANVHFDLGKALEAKGEKEAALDEYTKSCKLDPKNQDHCAAQETLKKQLP